MMRRLFQNYDLNGTVVVMRCAIALCRRNRAPASLLSLPASVSFSTAPRSDGKKRVVILGSGWGGFNVAKKLSKAHDRVDVTLISPANHFLFTPLLPGTAVGTLEFRAIQEPVRTLTGVHYLQAKARKIDTDAKQLTCQDIFVGDPFTIDYDELVVCVGSKTNTFGTKGIAENEGRQVFFLKHLYHARQIRNRVLECFERADIPKISDAEKERLLHFIVVGGGPTSVEFVSELHDFITEDVAKWYPDLQSKVQISIVESSDHLLGPFDDSLRNYVKKTFKNRNIDVRTGVAVKAVEKTQREGYHGSHTAAILSNGDYIPFGAMVWSAGLASVKFTNNAPFPLGNNGRILVDGKCRIKGEIPRQGLSVPGTTLILTHARTHTHTHTHTYIPFSP